MVQDIWPQTPEERAQSGLRVDVRTLGPRRGAIEIGKRMVAGVLNDGFIHAGNLAYLTLVTLFPFFILTATIASFFGRDADTMRAVTGFLNALPPNVGDVLRKPVEDVLLARNGSLLWLGGLVGLWTVGSYIETVRDILRRAYGTGFTRPFWHDRLGSIVIIMISVVVMMTAFSAQLLLVAAEQFVVRLFPFAHQVIDTINLSQLVPLGVIWGALYLLIWSLTPSEYAQAPKWPGALLIALWWYGALALMPRMLDGLVGYDLTYGSLAGVIIALLFFWLIGFGIVLGAHLNAALAEPPIKRLKGEADSMMEPL